MAAQTMEAGDRLTAAFEDEELKGLRLGARARIATMVVIAVWIGTQNTLSEAAYFWALFIGFILAGVLPYDHRRRGKQWRWPRYGYPLADAVLLTFVLLVPNPFGDPNIPAPLFLRFSGEVYFFILIASTVFYYAPRVVVRNLSTTLRHRRFLFTDSFLLLWKWRVG